jgi:hypothetical protein
LGEGGSCRGESPGSIDGPNGRAVDAVHILFAGEKLRPDHATPAPDVIDSVPAAQFHVVSLSALVQLKLNSNRDNDRTHLRDMIGVGIFDQSWLPRLPPVLAARLQLILETPDGRVFKLSNTSAYVPHGNSRKYLTASTISWQIQLRVEFFEMVAANFRSLVRRSDLKAVKNNCARYRNQIVLRFSLF